MGNVFDIFLLQITVSTEHGRSNSTIGKRVGGRRSVQRRSIRSSIKTKTTTNKLWVRLVMWCLKASSSYLRVGKLHRHHNFPNNNHCELPILFDCIVILKSHSLYIARHPAISGHFHVQMVSYAVLLKLLRIQAGDKLHQRLLSPMSSHKWFPIHRYTVLQPDRNVTNWRN